MNLQPGDIVLVRSETTVGALIRLFTRAPWEPPSKVNHVGIISTGGYCDIMDRACNIIEATTSKAQEYDFFEHYRGQPAKVAIFRPLNLSPAQAQVIIWRARNYVGDTYGFAKIVTSLLDWFLCGAYVFRRLTHANKWPICSWVVAHAYAAAGLYFGVSPGAATPDDIWDFVKAHPEKYMMVRNLETL